MEPRKEGNPEQGAERPQKRKLTAAEANKGLADAFIMGLRAWYADPKESVTIYIEQTVRYLAEEHPDAGDCILDLIEEEEPEMAETLKEARDRLIKDRTN